MEAGMVSSVVNPQGSHFFIIELNAQPGERLAAGGSFTGHNQKRLANDIRLVIKRTDDVARKASGSTLRAASPR